MGLWVHKTHKSLLVSNGIITAAINEGTKTVHNLSIEPAPVPECYYVPQHFLSDTNDILITFNSTVIAPDGQMVDNTEYNLHSNEGLNTSYTTHHHPLH